MSLHGPHQQQSTPWRESPPRGDPGVKATLGAPPPHIHASLLEARIACEVVLAREFLALSQSEKNDRSHLVERLASSILTVCQHFSSLDPEANRLSNRALTLMRSEDLPTSKDIESAVLAHTEASPLLLPLCGYVLRLFNWRGYFETLSKVHAGAETPEAFLIRNNLGHTLASEYRIQTTPLFIRVTNATPGPEDSALLMGRAPKEVPVILLYKGYSDGQNQITDVHEAVHLKVRADPAFNLPCPGKTLLGSLANEGFIGKVAHGIAPIDIPENAPPLLSLTGNLLLDLMHEEFAAQAIAGMGNLMLESHDSPGSLSSLLGSLTDADTAVDPSWLFVISNTESRTLATLGGHFRAAWITLFEASAGAGGICASHKTSTNPALPPRALSLLLDLSSSARRALLGVREGARMAQNAGGTLDERYGGLLLALQPSEYYRIPDLLVLG